MKINNMDYEEKYREALERCREFYAKFSNKQIKEEIEEIFPELAESEDGKIRKVLIGYFKENNAALAFNGISNEGVIAWLEKQGEQKSANWFQELEDKLANATPEQLAEWKEKYFKEEPAEWSEDDYNEIESIACHLDNIDNEGMAEVLRSIRDKYYHINPQSTWRPSKEQMEALRECIPENVKELSKWEMVLDGLYNDLKKLKD